MAAEAAGKLQLSRDLAGSGTRVPVSMSFRNAAGFVVRAGVRPGTTPRARDAARPARVRSMRSSRSIWASADKRGEETHCLGSWSSPR